MATTKFTDIPPKKNFILRNKLNVSRQNPAHVSRSSNEYKNTVSSFEKLKISGNRSAQFKNEVIGTTIKSKPDRQPSVVNSTSVSIADNQISQSEGDTVVSDPLRSISPDYTKFALLNLGKSYTSKAMQTINIADQEALLSDSIIRYPSAHKKTNSLTLHKNEFFEPANLSKIKNEIIRTRSLDGNDASSVTTDKTDNSMLSKNEALNPQQIRRNRAIKVLKSPNLLKPVKEIETIDPLKAPPNYKPGVLPRYLRNRRYPLKREDSDETCPAGHVTLPDSERRETLSVLRNRYATLVSELNKMPVRLQNAQDRKRKQSLEQELVTVEDGINVFSRPRVYVKLDV